jgi:hypothetical protein
MGMKIKCIGACQALDSSGESIVIEGMDISDLLEGKGVFNFEHSNSSPEDIVGKITGVKKIFGPQDCETDTQMKFWNHARAPYLYLEGELFDESSHNGAACLGAMARYCAKNKEPMMIGASIEGSTLARDGNILERTIAKRCALTLKPCNKLAITEMLDEKPEFKKALGQDNYKGLHKSVEIPFEYESEFLTEEQLEEILGEFVTFKELAKTLTAGGAMGSPGTLTQGAALAASEEVKGYKVSNDLKNKIKAKIRDKWDRITPIKEFLKAELPDLGDKFKEHFVDILDDISLNKGRNDIVTWRHTAAHIPHDKEQRLMIAGIRATRDDSKPFKAMNSYGHKLLIKKAHNSPEDSMFSSEKAMAYHNLAKDFFEMGQYVPMTSCFVHPGDRGMYHAQRYYQGAENGIMPKTLYLEELNRMSQSGDLHKMSIVDYVLGHSNRHLGNLALDKCEGMKLTENEDSFGEPNHPDYWHDVNEEHKMIPAHVAIWLHNLNPKALVRHAILNGVPRKRTKDLVLRLEKAKEMTKTHGHIEKIYE